MAKIIDSFVVAFGLDASKYKLGSEEVIKHFKKTKDEAARTSAEMEQRGASAAQFFGKLRTEALALLAVFTAGVGIKNFTENTIGTAAGLGFMSDNLGISTEKLTAWQKANERAGGSQAGIMAQLRESASESAKFKMGQTTDSQQWFYRLGGDPKALRDGNSFLLERSRIISEIYKKDPTRATEVAASMGITGDSFNLLKQGPAAVMALVRAQEKNTAVSREQAAAALALRNHWLDLRDRLLFTGTTILLHLMPTIDGITKKMTKLADYVAEHKDDIKQWVDKSLVVITKFVAWTDKAAQSVGGWSNVIIALVGLKISSDIIKLAAVLFSIGKSLTVIGAVGAGAVSTLAGAGAIVLGTATEANKGEEKELYNYYKDKKGPLAESSSDAAAKNLFTAIEKENGLKNGVLFEMWKAESNKGKAMLSPAGAQGHFGLMPGTAKSLGVKDPNDLEESAKGAAWYLRDLLRQNNGDYEKALSAYNWGPGNLSKKGMDSRPEETRKYSAKILAGMQNSQPEVKQVDSSEYVSKSLDSREYVSKSVETREYVSKTTEGGVNTSNETKNVETNFHGPITINSQATDAKGIATDFTSEINNIMAAQANTGLN